jgi:hypothetical protein
MSGMVKDTEYGLAPAGGAIEPSKGEQIRMIVEFFDCFLK